MFPRKIVGGGGGQTNCIMGDVLVVNIATKLCF